LLFAREGANVGIGDIREDEGRGVAAEITAAGGDSLFVRLDVTSEQDWAGAVDAVLDRFGRLDILVNNVGGMIPGTIESLSDEQWTDIINRNLMAFVWTIRSAIPQLKNSAGAKVLNVSGMTGKQLLVGALTTTLPNTAIIGFTKVMAGELAKDGITVNNICPGIVNTESWGPRAEMMAKVRGTTADQVRRMFSDLTLLGRWGEPEEIGNVAAFMVSDKNSYMTGTTVEVCGGWARYI
ncbi:MAG: SDR family oxidoreductase, partial [Nitrospinota bacterium]|nr:SDR family oxidoreductase [Nitrospinota bacterium]